MLKIYLPLKIDRTKEKSLIIKIQQYNLLSIVVCGRNKFIKKYTIKMTKMKRFIIHYNFVDNKNQERSGYVPTFLVFVNFGPCSSISYTSREIREILEVEFQSQCRSTRGVLENPNYSRNTRYGAKNRRYLRWTKAFSRRVERCERSEACSQQGRRVLLSNDSTRSEQFRTEACGIVTSMHAPLHPCHRITHGRWVISRRWTAMTSLPSCEASPKFRANRKEEIPDLSFWNF